MLQDKMIEGLILKLVNAFIENDLIAEIEKESYVYSLLCLIESWLTIGSILLIGFFVGKLFSTICFCFFFFTLRHRTGGFHFQTFKYCYISSLFLFGIICSICKIIENYNWVFLGLTFLSSLFTAILGTVNNPNIDMNEDELKAARSSSKWMLVLELLFIAFMQWMKISFDLIAYSCSGIILCTLLLIVAKLKEEVKV